MSQQKKSPQSQQKSMTAEAAARIHSAEAHANGGQVSKGSFTARAQKTVAAKANK
ncbi:hypothetical protein [Shewanella atlantica]|uniref:hypothetical protein n=1 Tax=Shewanella atlantica TaxID=271099 RepID=UPI00163AA929|nr:hypothetical protein [Shewanella atlantica]